MKSKKKHVSHSKRNNIKKFKLGKKGYSCQIFTEAEKKAKKIQKLNAVAVKNLRKKQQEENKKTDVEITGEEMLDMIDKDDIEDINQQIRPNTNSTTLDYSGEFRPNTDNTTLDYSGEDEPAEKTVVKRLLPVYTEEGWQNVVAKVPVRKKELTLTKFKRKHSMKREYANQEEYEDEDSGVYDEEEKKEEEAKEEVEEKVKEEDEQEEDAGENNMSEAKQKWMPTKSVATILAERKRYLQKQKIRMASLAMIITQNPKMMYKYEALFGMVASNDPESDVIVYKYLLITLLQLFHDLIPSYRIQENIEVDKMKKLKFETVKQEHDFLQYYKRYLQILEDVLQLYKKKPSSFGLKVLSETCVYCLGDLLVHHPMFNYSANIIKALVPYLNSFDEAVRKSAFEALSRTLQTDKMSLHTVDIVSKIYKLTFHMKFRVKEEVIRVLLYVRKREMKNKDLVMEKEVTDSKLLQRKDKLLKKLCVNSRKLLSRQKKKEEKRIRKVEKQMEVINAEKINNLQNERHSKVLESIFGLYIHVLKKKPRSKLMPVVLEGLAEFAHLINVDFFSDLLLLMNKFLEEGFLGVRDSLLCIVTVFTILSGQGQTLNVDPTRFYNQFYRILVESTLDEREENVGLILDIVDKMVIARRKQVSTSKVVSYTKRLGTLSLTMSHRSAVPTLVTLKKIFSLFASADALLDPDPDGSLGQYLPEVQDPEHSNASSSTLWEMTLNQRHYHCGVRLLAQNILSGAPAAEVPAVHALTKRTVPDLLEIYNHTRMKFNPIIPHPSAHLTGKKRGQVRPVFRQGSLELENIDLQVLCEGALQDLQLEGGVPRIPEAGEEEEEVPEAVATGTRGSSNRLLLDESVEEEGMNDNNPRGKEGMNVNNPRGKEGMNVNNPRGKEGMNVNNPRGKEGMNDNNPRGKEGMNDNNPRGKEGMNVNNPRGKEGMNVNNPRGKEGMNVNNPRGKEGMNVNNPRGKRKKVNGKDEVRKRRRKEEKALDELENINFYSNFCVKDNEDNDDAIKDNEDNDDAKKDTCIEDFTSDLVGS